MLFKGGMFEYSFGISNGCHIDNKYVNHVFYAMTHS